MSLVDVDLSVVGLVWNRIFVEQPSAIAVQLKRLNFVLLSISICYRQRNGSDIDLYLLYALFII
jgi:hypothetical protein